MMCLNSPYVSPKLVCWTFSLHSTAAFRTTLKTICMMLLLNSSVTTNEKLAAELPRTLISTVCAIPPNLIVIILRKRYILFLLSSKFLIIVLQPLSSFSSLVLQHPIIVSLHHIYRLCSFSWCPLRGSPSFLTDVLIKMLIWAAVW